VESPGLVFWTPNRKIAFKVETYKGRNWLSMRLPSGRKIKYYDPTWTPPKESERYLNGVLTPYTIPGFMDYMGLDTYTRQWMRLQTYGGKLDENADQGFSRDLLCNAMLALDMAGYCIVGSEHDKAILEVTEQQSVADIKRYMVTQPAYCDGLPLATDGKRLKRYGK
jgi:DNA polymerase